MAVNINKKTADIALTGILIAEAAALSFLEGLLPPLPYMPPGAKPGFSNIITMFAAQSLGPARAFTVAVAKAIFAGVTRGFSAFIMSLAGGLLSTLVMCILFRWRKSPFGFTGTGILSACAHNAGQLIAACLMMGTAKTLAYAPVLLVFAVITGFITGSIFKAMQPLLKKQRSFFKSGK